MQRKYGWQRACMGMAILLAILGLLLLERWNAVGAVQTACVRNWEIEFNSDAYGQHLPNFVREAVNWVLDLCCKEVQDDRQDLIGSSNPHHRREFYEIRSYTLFYGTIHKVDIVDPYGFSPELGDAIARFPRLEEVTFVSNDGPDWYDDVRGRKATLDPRAIPSLIAGITGLKRLRNLELSAPWVGDQEVLALGKISSLEVVSMQGGRFTAASFPAFARLPKLKTLTLRSRAAISKAEIGRLQKMLPGADVLVEAPEL